MMKGLRHILLVLVWVFVLPFVAQAQEIVVSSEGPVRTLEAAVAQAAPGSRIVVRSGVYENVEVVVDKPLEIVGQGRAVLDGGGERQILTIRAEGVTVRGLTFRNVATSFVEDRAAIKVEEGHGCVLEGNRLEDTFFGIYLARTAGCRVANNVILGSKTSETRSGNGIHLWYSKGAVIEGNRVRGHRDGIYMEFVEDSEIVGNVSEHNLRYGLHFMFSDRCAYRDNTFQDNDAGVAVMYTRQVEMIGNRFIHNWGPAAYGLLLKDITDSRVAGNLFERNTIGLYAEGSSRTVVEDNDFIENGWAVKIMANTLDSRFTHNNFVGNTFDVATNSRQSYSTFDANYWDHYQGYDLDRDGYGDVPFRPVRLFALMVEQNEPALILLRSLFVSLLDAAERVLPTLTPETLIDQTPLMKKAVSMQRSVVSRREKAES